MKLTLNYAAPLVKVIPNVPEKTFGRHDFMCSAD